MFSDLGDSFAGSAVGWQMLATSTHALDRFGAK
jgi:hypothetical protein